MPDKPLALQLCPLLPYLVGGLEGRLDLVRWFELDAAARSTFLAQCGAECRVLVTGGHLGCPPELMSALPQLGLVAINGVGYDKVDLALAGERGVRVTNTPGVLTEDVADLAVGLVIALRRSIVAGDAHVRGGRWPAGELPLGRKVSGSRFGILGLGRIGRAIADRLAPFGEVAYSARSAREAPYAFHESAHALARWADIFITACAATPATEGLVDARLLAELGAEGILVNVARGSIVDEEALAAALEHGAIAGAALDVFAHEPRVPQALRTSPRTLLTPHVGSATVETRQAMADLVLANIDAFLAGEALVSPVA